LRGWWKHAALPAFQRELNYSAQSTKTIATLAKTRILTEQSAYFRSRRTKILLPENQAEKYNQPCSSSRKWAAKG
jgi:hypothetical protein